MAYRWRFHPDRSQLADQLAQRFSLSHLAARLMVNRGVESDDEAQTFLRPSFSGMSDPFLMRGMEVSVQRILRARAAREEIVVYGDSDVDGVCGTALLTGFLRNIGCEVSTYIPNRLVEGYSLTDRGVAEILRRQAGLVITVDNGTTAVRSVKALREAGVDVIITDHHEPGPELPPALALLNPKVIGSGYPFPFLCGTGVAFQLLSALASQIPARGSIQDALHDLLRHSIAFVAMATICDCVPLVQENRALARAGLEALAVTNHPGLRALMDIAGVGREVQSDDVSFRLGPRINAAGRMGHADRALALLLSKDQEEAAALAAELDLRNTTRQELEAEIVKSAREQASRFADRGDAILVLADAAWHAGVVGIVASRMAGEFQRPAILIALGEERGRGSGRSAQGFDLHSALGDCNEHLVGFGGHAFAAGLEIENDRLDDFRQAMLDHASEHWVRDEEPDLFIDAEIPLGTLNPSLMHELKRLAPFGEGHANPILAAPDLEIDGEPRLVGKNQNHLIFHVKQSGVRRKAVAYGQGGRATDLKSGRRFTVAFTPRMNIIRGRPFVEMDVKDIRRQ